MSLQNCVRTYIILSIQYVDCPNAINSFKINSPPGSGFSVSVGQHGRLVNSGEIISVIAISR